MSACIKCGKKLWRPNQAGTCEACAKTERERLKTITTQRSEAAKVHSEQIVLTTETAHSLPVKQRLGIVSGECVFGLNLVKDLLAGARDIVGGRSETIQNAIRNARDEATADLCVRAAEKGADAVVAVSYTHTQMSSGAGTMIAVVATGTAVTLTEA